MTRKDFELIAKALKDTRNTLAVMYAREDTYRKVAQQSCLKVTMTLAHRLGSTNPRFDFDKFVKAAGREYKE